MSDRADCLAPVVPLIVDWYAAHRVALPWREAPTPYHVWISEIMLQQTRIEAAIPYYHRFLAALPDVAALASVDDDRLMALWQGLGYYSRARNLKKAARVILEKHGGVLPADAAALRALPGIGAYTAGAIASIAYGLPEPAVDGNVLRVVARLTASTDDVMSTTTRNAVTAALREVYPAGEEAAALTEGLMELGERVCIPNGEPRCEACPVAAHCRARQEGDPGRYPVRSGPKPRRIEPITVFLLRCGDRVALRRRPDKGLLAGLWEFPNAHGALSPAEAAAWLAEQGIASRALAPCGEAKHVFSHVEWHMTGFVVDCDAPAPSFAWFTPADVGEGIAVPTAFRYYVNLWETRTWPTAST